LVAVVVVIEVAVVLVDITIIHPTIYLLEL
jgi:hypothetical protein